VITSHFQGEKTAGAALLTSQSQGSRSGELGYGPQTGAVTPIHIWGIVLDFFEMCR